MSENESTDQPSSDKEAAIPKPILGTVRARLTSGVYDTLLAYSLLIFFGLLSMLLTMRFGGLATIVPGSMASRVFFAWLMLCVFSFFAWFWTRNGQTLGMRAWKLELRSVKGGRVNAVQALIRFVYLVLMHASVITSVLLGIYDKDDYVWISVLLMLVVWHGFFWQRFDKNNMALHDYLSASVMVKTDAK